MLFVLETVFVKSSLSTHKLIITLGAGTLKIIIIENYEVSSFIFLFVQMARKSIWEFNSLLEDFKFHQVYIGILDSKFRYIVFSAASLGTGMLVEYCIFSLQQEA